MNLFDFLATQSGNELLRLLEGVVNIVAAVLTGAALRNIFQLRKMIGGVIKPGLIKRLFRRARHGAPASGDVGPDAFQSLTIDQKLDSLKATTETLWIRQGIESQQTLQRLDRVDPPTRKH